MNMKEQVLHILREINPRISDDLETDLLKEGYIDSFEIVNVVMELEDAFQVEIDPECIIPENFKTLKAIIHLMELTCAD